MVLRLVEPQSGLAPDQGVVPARAPQQPPAAPCPFAAALVAMGQAQAALAAYMALPGPSSERAAHLALWAAGSRVDVAFGELAYRLADREFEGEQLRMGLAA